MSAGPTATPPETIDGLVRLRSLPPGSARARPSARRAVTTHRLGDLNGLFAGHRPATGGGKRIRICVIDTILQTGGAEWFATQLCTLANPEVFDVVVLTWNSQRSPLAERLKQSGITVVCSTSWSSSGLPYDHWKQEVLFEQLDRLRPDLLFFSSQYLYDELPRERLERYATVVRISNFHAEDLARTDFSAAAQVIACTQEQYDAVERASAGHLTLISTGVNTELFAPAGAERKAELKRRLGADGRPVVLFVARLGDPLKRTPLFEAVVREVKAQRPDVAFVVVGYFESHNNEAEPAFRAFASAEGVVWKERVDPWEMPDLYQAADILLSTSDVHEGLSNTVLQALAAGVVPVVTASAGMSELVTPGETGFLVAEPGAEVLARRVIEAADLDEPVRQRLVEAGRRRVEEGYSLAQSAAAYERAFVEVHRRRPVTVCVTDGYFGVGGAEWLAALLLLNADPEEIRFELVMHQERTPLVRWLQERGAVTHEAAGGSYSAWIAQGMQDAFASIRPDVVMPCTITTWPRHEPFYRLLAISQNASDAAVLTREQYEQADHILCVSEDVKDHLSADHQFKMSVLHNSIDLHMFKPDAELRRRTRDRLGIPAGARVVLWCGRMHEARKRVDVLQAAITALDGDPVHFLVVGYFRGDEGDRDGWLRFMDGRANVTWVEDVDPWDAPEHYAAADLYLSTSGFKQSDFEGLSVATVQALATALPVVSTRSGGQHEVVEDGRNGRLVATGDAAGLAAAIRDVLGASEADREAMGRRSRDKALESFDIRRHARTYTRLARLLRDTVGPALTADPELGAPGFEFEDAGDATDVELRTAASFLRYTWPMLRPASDDSGAGEPAATLVPDGRDATAAELGRAAGRLASGERLAVTGLGPDFAAAEPGALRAGAICGVLDHLAGSFPSWASAGRTGRDLVLLRR